MTGRLPSRSDTAFPVHNLEELVVPGKLAPTTTPLQDGDQTATGNILRYRVVAGSLRCWTRDGFRRISGQSEFVCQDQRSDYLGLAVQSIIAEQPLPARRRQWTIYDTFI